MASAAGFSIAAVLTLALAGCGAAASPESEKPPAESVTYVANGGATQDAQRVAFLEPFTARTGVNVIEDSPVNYAKLEQMVKANRVTWDVSLSVPEFAVQNCGTLLEPIDLDIVDTSRLDEGLVWECAVPVMKSAFLLVYNSDTYGADGPQSWADFFDVKKFPGKRSMAANITQNAAMEIALLADGVAPEDLYPLDIDRALDKLSTIKDDIVFWDTGAQSSELLQGGDVDMMIAWPGRAYGAAVNGATITPVWNQPIYFADVLVVPKGTPNKDAAMELLAEAVSASAQESYSTAVAYGPINLDAQPDFEETAELFVPLGQDNGTGITRDYQWLADNMTEMQERWDAFING
ncbi:ABC transporter substrate-binding protein [Microbacterium sp. A93]|uniref:ABC transporter substrate-binding protein n=1 Tax=Microbacterium sp. A93 TaxID=3450716 RepID=UPI003F440045